MSASYDDDQTPADVLMAMARNETDFIKSGCIPCGTVVRMGFFFDAFGRHRDRDDSNTSMYSSISRLWEAHRSKDDLGRRPDQSWYRFYYSGLGTPLNEDANPNVAKYVAEDVYETLKKSGVSQLLTSSDELAESVLRVQRLRQQMDVKGRLSGAAVDSVRELSLRPVASVFKDMRDEIARLPAESRRVYNVLSASTGRQMHRTRIGIKLLARDIEKNVEKFARNPVKGVRRALKHAALSQGIGRALEYAPVIRDIKFLAEMFGTGIDIRLKAARDQFREAITEVRQSMAKVRHVEISVFGADRGAVIARAFVNDLVKTYSDMTEDGEFVTLRVDGIEVKIIFMGLMDAVSHILSETEATLIGLVPGLQLAEADHSDRALEVPAAVQRCVHFVAAHELRLTQRLDSLRRTRGEERTYPGTSVNMVGGIPDGPLGFQAELMRIPLKDMLFEALKAGAAMDPLEVMMEVKPEAFAKFSSTGMFEWNSSHISLNDMITAYRQFAPPEPGLRFSPHMRVFLRWLGARSQDPVFKRTLDGEDTLTVQELNTRQAEAYTKLRQATSDLSQEMLRQSTTMEFMGAQSEADQARLVKLRGAKHAALEEYEYFGEMSRFRPFTSVWERLDTEAREMIETWEGMQKEYDYRHRPRGGVIGPRPLAWRPLAMMPAYSRPALPLTDEEVSLVHAWQDGVSGKNPLPDAVMAMFDLLVNDTILGSWEDQLLAPRLYFRTRDVDDFGVSEELE